MEKSQKAGKLIVIYGINNLGKTTQAEMLADRMAEYAPTVYLKYPLYDLEPSGSFINAYIRPDQFPDVFPKDNIWSLNLTTSLPGDSLTRKRKKLRILSLGSKIRKRAGTNTRKTWQISRLNTISWKI